MVPFTLIFSSSSSITLDAGLQLKNKDEQIIVHCNHSGSPRPHKETEAFSSHTTVAMAPPSPDIVLLDMMIRGRVILPDTIEYDCQLKKMPHDVAFHPNKPLFFILCHDIVDVKEALAFVSQASNSLSVYAAAVTLRVGPAA